MKTVVITGGTSGIGLACAKVFSDKEWKVFVIARTKPDESVLPKNTFYIKGDVSDFQSINNAVKEIYYQNNIIDVLISNAGFGISGPVEFTDIEDAKRLMDVNFMGSFYSAKSVLPYMRKNQHGRIVFISSLAALFSIPYQSFYSSSKAAINLLSGALDNEIKPLGIRSCVIMPGDVKTGFTAAREKSTLGSEIYGSAFDRAINVMENDETNGMSPDKIAKVVYKAANSNRVKPWYVPGAKYKLVAFLYRVLPISLVQKLLGKIYS